MRCSIATTLYKSLEFVMVQSHVDKKFGNQQNIIDKKENELAYFITMSNSTVKVILRCHYNETKGGQLKVVGMIVLAPL
jgi:hypothetical protein